MTRRRTELALGVLVAAFVWWFGWRAWNHQQHFGNFSFDLGIYDQGVWLLSRFEDPFVTVRGLHLFGHHTNFVLVLWVPFFWLGAGAGFLAVSEVVLIGAAGVVVFLLARDRIDDGLVALALAATFLLNPSVENQLWWTFHPDTIAILPVLCTWLWATRRRWVGAGVWAAIALLCKEDVALTLAAMAVVLAWRERDKRLLIPGLVSAVWFVVATRVLMNAFNAGLDPFYVAEFNHLGGNLREIVVNSIRHPSRWFDRLVDARSQTGRPYVLQLWAPFAVVPALLAPEVLLVLPQFFVNSVTLWPYAADATYHYSAMPVAGLTIATVEFVGRLRTVTARRVAVGCVLAAALVFNVLWSPSPLSDRGHPTHGVWRTQPHPQQAAVEAAVAFVPADADVSATFYIVPQMTHRTEIYEFPTPFIRFNYRVAGEPVPDPAGLDYVVVDQHAWYIPEHEAIYLALQRPGSGFEEVFRQGDIVVLQRTDDPLSDEVRAFAEREVGR